MPVFNSMKQPEVRPWGMVVTVAMMIALSVYTGTGREMGQTSVVQSLGGERGPRGL